MYFIMFEKKKNNWIRHDKIHCFWHSIYLEQNYVKILYTRRQVLQTDCKNNDWFKLLSFRKLQEDLTHAVKNMLRKFGAQRYIANLGHGMHPDHDPEKLATFIDTVHSYSETMNERKSSFSLDSWWYLCQ